MAIFCDIYIAHAILLKCENICDIDLLQALILQGGDNIEILPYPTRQISHDQ